jgi:iron complex outermembrane receptor protein
MPLSRKRDIAFVLFLSLFSAYTNAQNTKTQSTDTTNTTTLQTITVDGAADNTANSSDPQNVRNKTATLGALGDKKIMEVPYSVNTLSDDVLSRPEVKSYHDAIRYLPFVQGDGVRPQTRGIQGSVVQNSMLDGLNVVATTDYATDQFAQIQVLNGLAGSLYGPANPAGLFNFVSKRPTDFTGTSLSTGGRTGMSGYAGGDFNNTAGTFDKVKYRLTLLDDQGNGYVSDSHEHRELVSLATDVHFTEDTVLETNLNWYDYLKKGYPGSFGIASGVNFPSAATVARKNFGRSYAGDDNNTITASAHLKHTINDHWKIDTGLLRQIADRNSTNLTNSFTDSAGDYKTTSSTATASRFTINSYLISLLGEAYTGPIKHEMTFGFRGFDWKNYNPVNGSSMTAGSGSLNSMAEFDEPDYADFSDRYRSAINTQNAFIAGDTLTFTPQWSMMLSASQSYLTSDSYTKTGTRTSSSSDHGLSTSASLMYKPVDPLMLYLTHADSLQLGDTAPSTAHNAYEILSPFRSKEWETGAKLGLHNLNLSMALFQIDRPFAYTGDDGYYAENGKQRNRGIEFMADGNLTHDLHVFGGVAYLDPKLIDTASDSTDNTQIVGLAKYTINLLTVYNVPHVPGLSVDANSRYMSKRYTDNTNTTSVGGYTTFDVGTSYRTTLSRNTDTTFRLGVTNLTNKAYWTNIVPGALTGYTGTGTASASLGEPRMVEASVNVSF